MAGTELVEETGALGGRISIEVVGTIIGVTGGRMFAGNGGTHGSTYTSVGKQIFHLEIIRFGPMEYVEN